MRSILVGMLLAGVLASAASAKDGSSVVVIGPNGRALVEPYRIVQAPLGRLALFPAPSEPYVLVFPLLRGGVPARPGRWYPLDGVLCSGWRSGIEAGCVNAPALGGWLGSGIYTGLFRRAPVRAVTLMRGGIALLPYGNEATAVKLALHQRGVAATRPAGCVDFRATWTGPGASAWPRSFCVVASGGLYAGDKRYPLTPTAARFVIG